MTDQTPTPDYDAPPLAVVLGNANGGNAPEGRPVQGCMACATYRHEGRACPRHRVTPPGNGGAGGTR